MAGSNPRCGQLDHGEVVGGELLVACGDASEMFDLVKETLNWVAQAIEQWAEGMRLVAVCCDRG